MTRSWQGWKGVSGIGGELRRRWNDHGEGSVSGPYKHDYGCDELLCAKLGVDSDYLLLINAVSEEIMREAVREEGGPELVMKK